MPKYEEKQLIEALKQLKSIKPRQEWASLLKSQILAESQSARAQTEGIGIWDVVKSVFFQRKLAYSFAAFVFVIAGMFGFAQYTVPGDALFPVKKITEQMQTSPLIMAVNRSNEAVKMAKSNKDALPAINEMKASLADAAKNVAQSIADNNKDSIKQIAQEVKKIEENQKQLEILGVKMGESDEATELDSIMGTLVKNEIDSMEKAQLTDAQKITLVKIKELYEQKKYSEALKVILLSNT